MQQHNQGLNEEAFRFNVGELSSAANALIRTSETLEAVSKRLLGAARWFNKAAPLCALSDNRALVQLACDLSSAEHVSVEEAQTLIRATSERLQTLYEALGGR